MATITCDVREDLRKGLEPFKKIMKAVSQVGPGDRLELLTTFEPKPLYKVLGLKGFKHESQPLENGDWRVIFFKEEKP